jgi:hypothetical protein
MDKDWPISGTAPHEHTIRAHHAAMRAAGWRPLAVLKDVLRPTRRPFARTIIVPTEDAARAEVGARVLVSLDNGYEAWGTVTKVYRNGARRVRDEASGKGSNRAGVLLWVR